MQTVYIETTIPSYLAALPNKLRHIADDQQVTHEWWANERSRFRLYTSIFTITEASRGDPGYAAKRLGYLSGIPEVDLPPELPDLERDIVRLFQIPSKAVTDASHLGLAILHGIDYLLTWNCTHLANAVLQKELIEYCMYHGLHIPVVCTPRTLSLLTP